MLEKYLIGYCAPTLASLKTASLFTYSFSSETTLQQQVTLWNHLFQEKGVKLFVLRRSESSALIYVYRPARLAVDLIKSGVPEFLQQCGYNDFSVEYALKVLAGRIAQCREFPHEIGLFLGYPLGDVEGFIENRGKNWKCLGCWKAYCNECEAAKTFAKFKKCSNVYARLWQNGRSILQLTVAA